MIDGWTALAESTGRLPGLALNLAQLQQQGQHMRALEADSKQRLVTEGQRFGMEKERMETENATAKLALGEAQKKQQFLDSGWEPAVDPGIRALPEKDRQGFIDTINTMGIPKTQRGRLQAEQILESTSKLFKSYTDSLFQGKYDAYQQVEQEYNAALEKGDPEKIAVLKQKFDAAETEVNRSRGEIDKGIKIVAMNEAWNKISPELKTSHPELAPLYVNGQRTGDTKPFTDALEEIGKRVAAVPVIKSVDRGDVVDIYENGVKVRTEKKGVSPGTQAGAGEKGVNATIYNVKDPTKTKKVFVKKGEDYEPPEGWTLNKPGKKSTMAEDLGLTDSQPAESPVYVNPVTKERIRWDGIKWAPVI